ncbi:hypothetical protein [Vibrio jasicida]|uniref:hypothetical protein n=1 Tax=Vibrio jasicida TaxID=766224 RepID=UPI001640F784|nr:hypothetical protein [Vibrio jasicida]
MRFIIVVLSIIIFGCSNNELHTDSNILVKKEEVLEVKNIHWLKSKEEINRFIKRIEEKHPNSEYILKYKIESSEAADKVNMLFNSNKVSKVRYKLKSVSDQDADVVIHAYYSDINDRYCPPISIFNKDRSKFGCTVDYNRKISLSTPLY